jgi:hypothetical protein
VLWLVWRRRAALDAQPNAPARVLAAAVATRPEVRRDWGAADRGLYLDADAPDRHHYWHQPGRCRGWLLLVVAGLMIPLGILAAALATVVLRAIRRTLRTSSDEAAAGSAGIGRTSGS